MQQLTVTLPNEAVQEEAGLNCGRTVVWNYCVVVQRLHTYCLTVW
jgi:hypothetical protein